MIPCEASYGHDLYIHVQKTKVEGLLVQKIEWKQVYRRTRPIALSFPPTWSVITLSVNIVTLGAPFLVCFPELRYWEISVTSSTIDTVRIVWGAGSTKRSSVHLSVCPVDRQQQRRAAGLLPSARRAGDVDGTSVLAAGAPCSRRQSLAAVSCWQPTWRLNTDLYKDKFEIYSATGNDGYGNQVGKLNYENTIREFLVATLNLYFASSEE